MPIELNDGLRQRVADFVASGQGGTDAGFLAAVEREVTGILYGWAGLDGDGAARMAGAGAMQAKFLDSYFGNQAGVGIAEVLPPEAISDMFNEVRDTAILKLAGQGPMAGLFRDLAYDADADTSDRQRRHGPERADRVRKQCRDPGAGRRGRGMAGAG